MPFGNVFVKFIVMAAVNCLGNDVDFNCEGFRDLGFIEPLLLGC